MKIYQTICLSILLYSNFSCAMQSDDASSMSSGDEDNAPVRRVPINVFLDVVRKSPELEEESHPCGQLRERSRSFSALELRIMKCEAEKDFQQLCTDVEQFKKTHAQSLLQDKLYVDDSSPHNKQFENNSFNRMLRGLLLQVAERRGWKKDCVPAALTKDCTFATYQNPKVESDFDSDVEECSVPPVPNHSPAVTPPPAYLQPIVTVAQNGILDTKK